MYQMFIKMYKRLIDKSHFNIQNIFYLIFLTLIKPIWLIITIQPSQFQLLLLFHTLSATRSSTNTTPPSSSSTCSIFSLRSSSKKQISARIFIYLKDISISLLMNVSVNSTAQLSRLFSLGQHFPFLSFCSLSEKQKKQIVGSPNSGRWGNYLFIQVKIYIFFCFDCGSLALHFFGSSIFSINIEGRYWSFHC